MILDFLAAWKVMLCFWVVWRNFSYLLLKFAANFHSAISRIRYFFISMLVFAAVFSFQASIS